MHYILILHQPSLPERQAGMIAARQDLGVLAVSLTLPSCTPVTLPAPATFLSDDLRPAATGWASGWRGRH